MKLLDLPPCEQLSQFIECYWYVEAGPHETSCRPDAILPNGTSNLIFNLSGFPHREFSDASFRQYTTLKTRWFSGIRDEHIIVGPTVCTNVIGVRFKPAGLLPFMDVPPQDLARATIEPDALWGIECETLHEQLFNASSPSQRFTLLECWMLSRLDASTLHAGLLRSVDYLHKASGNVSMEQLARIADLSVRHFRRRFEQAVGLTPKRLARVLRFQKLIQQLGTTPLQADWATLAIDCGYYDQAHLIADFREFADVTPNEYIRRTPAVPGFLPVDAPMSLFSNTTPSDPVYASMT